MSIRSFAAIVAFLAAIAFPIPASAASTDECQARIAALRADVAGTTFANAKDQTGLLGKLDNAAAALTAGKDPDAVQKLTDFRTKVGALGSAGKLASGDAARLDAAAADAIGCIQPIAP